MDKIMRFWLLSAIIVKSVFATSVGYQKTMVARADTMNFVPKMVVNKNVIDYFHHLLPTTVIKNVYSTPYPDTYALVIGSNLVYGNLHSSYLTVGHMFNIYTQDDITARLQKLNIAKIDLSKINISDAIVVKSSHKVHKKLIIFIDPDCPYCRELEQQLVQQHISKKADLYYMLMPLSIHPNATTHATNILCSTTPIKTLQDYMVKNNNKPEFKLVADCNIDPVLERNAATARLLSINATPVIITGSGELIMGDDIDAINEYLAK